MKPVFYFIILIIILNSCKAPDEQPRVPLKETPENALIYNQESITVYDSLLIADMESQTGWTSETKGSFSFTNDRFIDGNTSLRLEYPFIDTSYIAANARASGTFRGDCQRIYPAILSFDVPQDWTNYNRISMWIYVDAGSDGIQDRLALMLDCQDIPTPEIVTPRPLNYIHSMKAGQWNHVFWEIPQLPRHKITRLSFRLPIVGHGFGKTGIAQFDIDRIQLQRVDIPRNEGWLTVPGKISFSHTGYTPDSKKVAISSSITGSEFQIINENGTVVLSKQIDAEKNNRGIYQLLDFSEVTTEGTYYIKAGDITTRTFRIAETVWNSPIEKAINFFYHQRCGYTVPGVHDVCHQDWQTVSNGEKKIINGGWHDAGDLCQGAHQTGLTIYGMLELMDKLSVSNDNEKLLSLATDEARWGLDWWLKSRYPDGNRLVWSTMRIYTDNIIGNFDDVISPAQNVPWVNFISSGIESYAHELFREKDTLLARKCLTAAVEDWNAALAGIPAGWEADTTVLHYRLEPIRLASWGVVSSIRLYKITGNEKYLKNAVAFGKIVLNLQETSFKEGIPITGYFYNTTEKKSIVHYTHQTFDESPLLALADLCGALPNHPDWINWYGAIVLYSEYFMKRGAQYSSPYLMVPASVYSKSELLKSNEIDEFGFGRGQRVNAETKAVLLKQLEEGERLSDNYFLRRFPVQVHLQRHGSTSIQLAETVALSLASKVRNDLQGEALVKKQIEWIVGANPFSQSIMYGEGYDYCPLFSASSGNIVGALPVGMDCMKNDEPFWYNTNQMTTKEVWVVPTGRFLWNMAYTGTQGIVKGKIEGKGNQSFSVVSANRKETKTFKTNRKGEFSILLPSGAYQFQSETAYQNLTVLRGSSYLIHLDSTNYIDFNAFASDGVKIDNKIQINIAGIGAGSHTFSLRCYNGSVEQSEYSADFLPENPETEFVFNFTVTDPEKPWVIVVIPDNDLNLKQELIGKI